MLEMYCMPTEVFLKSVILENISQVDSGNTID